MSESELVRLAKAGDQDAFSELVQANQNKIYSLCVRMTGNPEDGADLAQEAFLRAWRSLPSFQEQSSFSTWLYRLANNLCIDFLRRETRRRTAITTVALEGDEDTPAPEVPDHRPSPERELERKDLRAAVAHGLARLSDEHRQVLVLREIEGLSYEEIGAYLDLEQGTVKSRIARARMALRKILLQDGNFSDLSSSTLLKSNEKE